MTRSAIKSRLEFPLSEARGKACARGSYPDAVEATPRIRIRMMAMTIAANQ